MIFSSKAIWLVNRFVKIHDFQFWNWLLYLVKNIHLHNFDFVNTLYFFTLKGSRASNAQWWMKCFWQLWKIWQIHTCTKLKIWLCIIDIYILFSSWIQLRTNSLYFFFFEKASFSHLCNIISDSSMEDGGVDGTVIDCRQNSSFNFFNFWLIKTWCTSN